MTSDTLTDELREWAKRPEAGHFPMLLEETATNIEWLRQQLSNDIRELAAAQAKIAGHKRVRELLIKSLCRATGRSREIVEEGPFTCAVEHAKEVERLLRAPQQQASPVYAAPPPDDEAVRLLREVEGSRDAVCFMPTHDKYCDCGGEQISAYLARKEPKG